MSDAIVAEDGFEIGLDVFEVVAFAVLKAVLANVSAVYQSVSQRVQSREDGTEYYQQRQLAPTALEAKQKSCFV